MNESKYVEAIYVPKVLLTITGVWPKKDYGFWYTLYGFFASFLLPTNFLILSAMTVFSQSTDTSVTIFTLFYMISVVTLIMKAIVFLVKKDTFHKIICKLEQPLFNNYDQNLDVYMKKAILIANRIRKLMQYPSIFAILILFVYPLSVGSKRTWPFETSINTNELSFSLYVCGYWFEIITVMLCGCNVIGIDNLICSFMALGTVQFQILRKNLISAASKHLEKNQESLYCNLENYRKFDEEVGENVKKCVKHHLAITKYMKKLEEMFTYIFLAQFLTSIVVICLTGIGLLLIPTTNKLFASSVLYFVIVISEISLFCLFGDELILQSLEIGNACYMSEWNNCGPEIRKSLFIIMEISKRPLALTSGKFTTLSRDSLVKILKSSISCLFEG